MKLHDVETAWKFLVERFPSTLSADQVEQEWRFLVSWHQLADAGAVDGYGGAECRRVHGEWVAAGRPLPLTRWMQTKGYLPELANEDDGDVLEDESDPLDDQADD